MSWEISHKKKYFKEEWNNKSHHRKDSQVTAKLLNGTLHSRNNRNQPKQSLSDDESTVHSHEKRTLRRSSSVSNPSSSVKISKSKFYNKTKCSDRGLSHAEIPSRIVRSREGKSYENNHKLYTEKNIKKISNNVKSIQHNSRVSADVPTKKQKKNEWFVSKNQNRNLVESSVKHKNCPSKQSNSHIMEKQVKNDLVSEGFSSDSSNKFSKGLSFFGNGEIKQKELPFPILDGRISTELNLCSSNQKNSSSASVIQLHNKQMGSEPSLQELVKDLFGIGNVQGEKNIQEALVQCENDVKLATEHVSCSKLAEKLSNGGACNVSGTLTNESECIKSNSVHKDSVFFQNDKYKAISPVIKNSISKSLRNRIKLKSLNLKVEEEESDPLTKPIGDDGGLDSYQKLREHTEVLTASSIGVSSQTQKENGVNSTIKQDEVPSPENANPCTNNSSLKLPNSTISKAVKHMAKAKKSHRFVNSASEVRSKSRILRAKARVLRTAKLQCRLKLLRYHNADASSVKNKEVAALQKTNVQSTKHKTHPKHNSKAGKLDGLNRSVSKEAEHGKATHASWRNSEKSHPSSAKDTIKGFEMQKNKSARKSYNANHKLSSNTAVQRFVPKSTVGVKSNSLSRTVVLKSIQTAKKTLQGSGKLNSTSLTPHSVEISLKKKKKRKYFRGGRYSLSISGVPKKRRKVSETSSSTSPPQNSDKSTCIVHAKPSTSANIDSVCSSSYSKNAGKDLSGPSQHAETHRSADATSSDQDSLPEHQGPRQVARKSFNRYSPKEIADEPVQEGHSLEDTEKIDCENYCDSQSFSGLLDYFSHIFHSTPVTLRKLREKFQIQRPIDVAQPSSVVQHVLNYASYRMKSTNGDASAKKTLRRQAVKSASKNCSFNLPEIPDSVFRSQLLSGNLAKVIQSLGNGANPHIKFQNTFNTPLHIAAAIGHRPMVQLLTQAGACLEVLNNQLKTPLAMAIEKGFLSIVEYLLMAGASVLCKDEAGMTPFHIAARGGYLNIMKLIYKSKPRDVEIDERDNGGWTVLSWACELGHYDIVNWLLDIGADPDVKDRDLNSAVHWAAFSGCEKCLSIILEKGINVNAVNKVKDTALHIASRKNHYECVKVLVSNGAAIDKRNNDNLVPLLCCTDYSSETWKFLQSLEIKFLTEGISPKTSFVYGDLTKGKEKYPIEVVNDVTQEQFSPDFCYVTELCESPSISINRNIKSMNSCHCRGICSKGDCSCGMLSFRLCYGRDRCLVPDFDIFHPPVIFECSKICSCDNRCLNRVVQHGIRYHLQLFHTLGKGWGVRSLCNIPKGAFICEYLGELITEEECERREDDSYIFELDNEDSQSYYIDAKFYGNVSRFLNHSCSPNLTTVKVFTEHQDLHFPRIAFFTNRDIEAKEELCFDYGENFWLVKSRYFLCVCGSRYCKYSSMTITETLGEYCARQKKDVSDS